MTTPALDTALAADFVAPVRLVRVDLPSGVTIRWATASMEITRASDGTYHAINDTYGTLLDAGTLAHKLAEHTNADLSVHAWPALTTILQSAGANRSRVRMWDVAVNLDTGALIDTDIPDFDGWIGDRTRTVAEKGDTWSITCVARSIRADDPDQSALMNDATQTRYLADGGADRFFEYTQVLPETLPWGSAASTIMAPPRQGPGNVTAPPGTDFYFPSIEFL